MGLKNASFSTQDFKSGKKNVAKYFDTIEC